MDHIYLSPHLDDAILSCGGLIHQQRAVGEAVTVITLCAGSPDYTHLSPFAQQYHAAWGISADPVAGRRAEDRAVLDKWGVTSFYSNTLDSIYRRVDGVVAYSDLAALFAEPHPYELTTLPELWRPEVESLGANPAQTIFYAPLAAGNHVDHQLVRTLAMQLRQKGWEVWFYEDYPHAEAAGVLQTARDWFGPVRWESKVVAIDVAAKIAAISGYRSQVPFIFGDERTMVRRVKLFTAERACDISLLERTRQVLVKSGGRRERIWRTILGYHAYAERFWRLV